MSVAPTTAAGAGLPVTSPLHEPAFVRNGSAAVKQDYATAEGFEEMLLQQLSQSLLQSGGLGGEGGEGEGEGLSGGGEEGGGGSSESGAGVLGSLLPQALGEGLMRDGGLGLAGQLVGALDPAAAGAGGRGGSDVDSSGVRAGARAPAYARAHTSQKQHTTSSADRVAPAPAVRIVSAGAQGGTRA
ncbi:MAG TPA: hypothetical protein VMU32_01680 [Solirubrobacteraceae bacterium]|nr:hypothetical protein [Solirubrobacteraceae bacterium]